MDNGDMNSIESPQIILSLEFKQRILKRVPCHLLIYHNRLNIDFHSQRNKIIPVKFKIYHEEVEKIIYKRENNNTGEGKMFIYANGLKNIFYHHYNIDNKIENIFINYYGDDFIIIK